MALPGIGGGYQVGDGNVNEVVLFAQGAPEAATATATLTAAQIIGGILVGGNGTTAATYTLPTVAAVEAIVGNAKVDSAFELIIINTGTSTGAVTIAPGTGWSTVGSLTVAVTSSARYLARKTGEGTWTLYRAA
jgi:hypothetical protein